MSQVFELGQRRRRGRQHRGEGVPSGLGRVRCDGEGCRSARWRSSCSRRSARPTPPNTINAGNSGNAIPRFPITVTVGQEFTGQVGLGIIETNANFESAITNISLIPSCSTTAANCEGGFIDPDVFALDTQGTGQAGPPVRGRPRRPAAGSWKACRIGATNMHTKRLGALVRSLLVPAQATGPPLVTQNW